MEIFDDDYSKIMYPFPMRENYPQVHVITVDLSRVNPSLDPNSADHQQAKT